MARLHITAELLIASLFEGKVCVDVRGATFDPHRGTVVLDIDGPDVPAVAEVVAIVRVNDDRKVEEVTFKPC